MVLNGANTFGGVTSIQDGALRVSSTANLSSNSALRLSGGVIELADDGMAFSPGKTNGQLQWTGSGGFSAFGTTAPLITIPATRSNGANATL